MSFYILPFIISTIAVNLTPGVAMFYCINSALKHGRYSGIMAAIGVELGVLLYVVIIAVGLSQVITSSTLLYNMIKLTGSGYLLYLAFTALPKRNAKVSNNRDQDAESTTDVKEKDDPNKKNS